MIKVKIQKQQPSMKLSWDESGECDACLADGKVNMIKPQHGPTISLCNRCANDLIKCLPLTVRQSASGVAPAVERPRQSAPATKSRPRRATVAVQPVVKNWFT